MCWHESCILNKEKKEVFMLRIVALSFAFVLAAAFAANPSPTKTESPGPIQQTIEDQGAKYLVTVEPEKHKIEVVREGPTLSSPPQLRLRIHRDPEPPIDIRLRAIQPQDPSPLRYAGRIDKWNQSYMGFELQFSFDKKTWSRLGKIFR
jgi:anti-sigma-K factor RskA